MTTVTLSRGDVELCRRMAKQSVARFVDVPGHYANKYRTHFVGRAGEMALSRWLFAAGLEHFDRWLDPMQADWCDIETFEPFMRLEVKTWSRAFWAEYGRCVAASQLKTVEGKADRIVWLVADVPQYTDGLRRLTVEVAGWNFVTDITELEPRLTGLTGKRQVLNYQLRPDELRRMEDFHANQDHFRDLRPQTQPRGLLVGQHRRDGVGRPGAGRGRGAGDAGAV